MKKKINFKKIKGYKTVKVPIIKEEVHRKRKRNRSIAEMEEQET